MLFRRAVAGLSLLAVVVGPGCSRTVGSESLTVFAASSLTESFELIATEFEAERPGVDVVITSAGSNTLASQISEGAPADVFASADSATMDPLISDGLVGSPRVFAHNRMEIAVADGNPYDIDGIESLDRPDLRIALCAVEVPCGAYTMRVLDSYGYDFETATRETSVAAVVTKVRLGEVDAGLVYHTDVVATDGVEGVEINTLANVSSDYLIAAVADGDGDNSTAFIDFVLSDRGQQILTDAGFDGA